MAANEKLQIVIEAKDEASSKIQQMKSNLSGLKSSFAGIAGVATTVATSILAVGTAAFTAGAFALREASKFENLEQRFKVMLGTTEMAKERLKELNTFALVTPYQVEEVAQASAILQTFGGTALATGAGLKLVGDMAAYSQQPIAEVAVHVGRAVDALQSGRSFGESAQRLQELGLVTGDARAYLESFAGQTMSAAEAQKVFGNAIVEVDGTMEELNNTMTGQLSNLEQQFREKMRLIGEHIYESFNVKETLTNFSNTIANINIDPLLKIIDQIVYGFTWLKNKIKEIVDAVKKIVDDDMRKQLESIFGSIVKILKSVLSAGFITAFETIKVVIMIFVGIMKILLPIIEPIMKGIAVVVGVAADILGGIFTALGKLITGDFAGAWQSIKNTIFSVWNGIVEYSEIAVNFILNALRKLFPAFDMLAKKAEENGVEMKVNFDSWKVAVAETATTSIDSMKKTEEANEKTKKSYDGVGGSAKKASKDGSEAVINLADSIEKSAASIQEKLGNIQKAYADLNKDFAKKEQDDRVDVAEAVVKSEENIAKLKEDIEEKKLQLMKDTADKSKDIANTTDAERKAQLQADLNERTVKDNEAIAELEAKLLREQEAQIANAEFIKQIDTEVAEVRRFNGLTTLEQSIENYTREREQALIAFEEKKAQLAMELEAVRLQQEEISKKRSEVNAKIKEDIKNITKANKQELDAQLAQTDAAINQMIAMYQRLQAIQSSTRTSAGISMSVPARASGGPVDSKRTYLVGERGPELFTPERSGNIIPNESLGGSTQNIQVNVTGTFLSDDSAEKVADMVVRSLKLYSAVV